MENRNYMREGIDSKRVFLLLREKFWMAAAAVIAGAAMGAGIYLLVHLVLAPEREYQSVSKIYLNFNCDPEEYNELAYNGYTWNDLMVTDPIMDYTMQGLPEGISREQVAAATKAEILSDIRLLTVTITAQSGELAGQIMEATQKALVHLGETDPLFTSIEIYSTTEPKQILWDNRTVRAAVTGAVIAFFAAVIVLCFYYTLDDSVYVGCDVEKRYGIPALGVFPEGEWKERRSRLASGGGVPSGREAAWQREFDLNYAYLCRACEQPVWINADRVYAGQTDNSPTDGGTGASGDDGITIDYEKIRKAGGAILEIGFGRRNGKRVERLLSNLEKQDCKVLGAVVTEADEKFLKLYYMTARRKKKE